MERVHNERETSLLRHCQARLEAASGVPVRISKAGAHPFDYRVRLGTTPPIQLLALLRRQGKLTSNQVHHLALTSEALLRTASKGSRRAVLLLAPWINAPLAQLLREKGIFFADAVGNISISIDRPRVVLNIQGNRPEARPKAEPGRMIEPSGLKVIHLLLAEPDTLALPYRSIAPRAGVSFASVGIVLRALSQAGHVVARGRRLQNVPALVDHFVRGYALKLRPEIHLGTFRHRIRDFDPLLSRLKGRLGTAGGRWALTGGAAGGVLTRYLRTDHVALMVDEASEAALRKEPLLPASPQESNVTLLRLFAPSAVARATKADMPTATPLLVYAELLHDGRGRELETAELLRPLILPTKKRSES